jgi:receptor kinase-like protein
LYHANFAFCYNSTTVSPKISYIFQTFNATEYGAGNVVSVNGDIYSYGILVLETVTGKRPTDNMFTQGMGLREYVEQALHVNTPMEVVDIRLPLSLKNEHHDAGALYNRKIDCLISLLKLGLSCSEETPSSRMPTGDIIKGLLAIKESLL